MGMVQDPNAAFRMENPLVGVFNRERTVLTFRPRSLEYYGSLWAMGGGGLMVALGLVQFLTRGQTPSAMWLLLFGFCFFGAGVWAYRLFRMLKFDIRKRMFIERQNHGLSATERRGSIDEIRHLEIAPYSGLLPNTPYNASLGITSGVFVLRLWWKDPNRPPVVVEHVMPGVAYGMVDNQMATFVHKAKQYADMLRVPLFSAVPLPGLAPMT